MTQYLEDTKILRAQQICCLSEYAHFGKIETIYCILYVKEDYKIKQLLPAHRYRL